MKYDEEKEIVTEAATNTKLFNFINDVNAASATQAWNVYPQSSSQKIITYLFY